MDDGKKNSLKRNRSFDDGESSEIPKILRSTIHSFDWKNLCFICGKTKSQGIKHLIKVSISSDVQKNVFKEANTKQDQAVIKRLSIPYDLSKLDAGYHASCYKNYCRKKKSQVNQSVNNKDDDDNLVNSINCDNALRNSVIDDCTLLSEIPNNNSEQIQQIDNIERTVPSEIHADQDDTPSYRILHSESAKLTFDYYKNIIKSGEIISFTDICDTYKFFLKSSTTVRSSFIKCKLQEVAEQE